jgi:hypothetical protein
MTDTKVSIPVISRVPAEVWRRILSFVPENRSKQGTRCLLVHATVSRAWKVCYTVLCDPLHVLMFSGGPLH